MPKNELDRTLYHELRQLAHARMRRLRPGQTLQPTELVHEVYLRLARRDGVTWNNRGHFFGAAARAMRDILVDQARRKGAQKRGGDLLRVDITMTLPNRPEVLGAEDILALHRALERMEQEQPRSARLVAMYYFAGLSWEEIGDVMGMSRATVSRRRKLALAWLKMNMDDAPTLVGDCDGTRPLGRR